ncbi:peptidoglycan DD-metalloendopeptidase family protein [Paenalcaligenes sp. Me131]|uniref:peptidoglycan DD-metalloendopeptidase family protein n=1 Tax=Paenalcaligenes sp. Me131 TaxID=3392636 RepID=UPI003D26E8B4
MQHSGGRLMAVAENGLSKSASRSVVSVVLLSVVLAGCASRMDKAPIVDGSAGGPTGTTQTAQNAGGTYQVRAGDTLYKIAQAHGMSVSNLSRINNITDPSQLRVGQVLQLGEGATQVAVTTPVTPPPTKAPAQPEQVPPTSGTTTTPAATGTVQRASDANLIAWAWPANGPVIQAFTTATKGIDLSGAIGDPIRAAADGKVMYAGNGVRGLGNLILLGHSNGFITAYAHNDKLSVKTGDEVKKGQTIASLGESDTTSPRLHFEIRRRGTPVNPLAYLPAR